MARKESIWQTEKYTTKSGKTYQRYVLDDQGNKVLKDGVDPATVDPEEFNPKEAAKKRDADPNRKRRPARKAHRRIIPSYVVDRMRTALNLHCTFEDKRDAYRVILTEVHATGADNGWLLVRAMKRNSDKIIFFNIITEEWILFQADIHKPGYGNKSIIWPPPTDGKPLVDATKTRAAKLERAKAAKKKGTIKRKKIA